MSTPVRPDARATRLVAVASLITLALIVTASRATRRTSTSTSRRPPIARRTSWAPLPVAPQVSPVPIDPAIDAIARGRPASPEWPVPLARQAAHASLNAAPSDDTKDAPERIPHRFDAGFASANAPTPALLRLMPSAVAPRAPALPRPAVTPGRVDWRTLRHQPGITFEGAVTSDASTGSASLRGARGLRAHTVLSVALDLDTLVGWRGLSLYAEHKIKRGRNASELAEAIQSVSNIDADDFRAFGEVFVEQRLVQERVRLRLGRLDFNSDFAGTDHGGDFLNASMGFSPSVTAAPTYPLPSIGASAMLAPVDHVSINIGVYDGRDGAPAPSGGSSRFLIGQLNLEWQATAESHAGRLGVGRFHHTGVFPTASASAPNATDDPPSAVGVNGWYATLDQNLWHGAATAGQDRDVGVFLQVGRSDRHVHAVRDHIGGGLTLSGLVPSAVGGTIGVGATRAAWHGGRESIGEAFHMLPLFGGLTLISDVQRVYRYDVLGSRRVGNVFTLRTVVAF